MALTIRRRKSRSTLSLEGSATIMEAEQLRDALAECIDEWDGVRVDLLNVGDMDTAGMQVLVSASVTAGLLEKQFAVTRASESVTETCRLLGLESVPPFSDIPR